MGKRLLIGLGKGSVTGLILGLAVQVGLGWTTPGLLGGLFAACVGATAGVVGGRPPWAQEGVIEALLKAGIGLAVGALAFWGLTYLHAPLGFSLGFLDPEASWHEQPLFLALLVAAVFGSLVELDTLATGSGGGEGGEKGKSGKTKGSAKKKAADLDAILAEVEGRPTKKKK